MQVKKTPLAGLIELTPKVFSDDRGFFKEIIQPQVFRTVGINHRFLQVNQSRSKQWVLRGLHYQKPPYSQSKLVRCLRGKIFDVAVDIRPGSVTFGQWYGVELSDENHKMLYVPIGFAHGFMALTDCDIEYACGDVYAVDFESGIHWNDQDINIDWPIGDNTPIVSKKDHALKPLSGVSSKLFWPDEAYVEAGFNSDVK